MRMRTLLCGVVTFMTILSAGCCHRRHCCAPCNACCTSCGASPVSYNSPATFTPLASKELPPIRLTSDSTR
jgi:hypothetical protein